MTSARVSRRDALKATAVLRARNLIAGVCSTLPIELRDAQRNLDEREWLGLQPNDNIEDTVTYASTYEDLLFEATSYWRVTQRGPDGFPVLGEHLDHRSVSTGVNLSMPSRMISEDLQFAPDDPIFVDGLATRPGEIVRFVSPNPPMLVHAGKAIRTLLLLDRIASEYAANPLPFGYFKDAADEPALEDEQVLEVLGKWERARRDRMWGYVESGLELNMLQWPTPQQLQLIESRNHAVLEIARAAGLEPEDLATVVEGTSRTYQNSEQRRLDMIDFTLMPFLSSVQDRLSMNDVTPKGLFARYRIGAFARADTKSRYETYKTGLDGGFIEVNEIRHAERLPDMPEQGTGADDTGDPKVEATLNITRASQQVYLAVTAKVLTKGEARDILRGIGAPLEPGVPEELEPEPAPAVVPPSNGNGAVPLPGSNGNEPVGAE
jgi:hypothetical protein